MDTLRAFALGEAARRSGSPTRVFDWDKAARILCERLPDEAIAGLATDLSWTAGVIWRDGGPCIDEYTYLASCWATPVLVIDDEEIPCWSYQDERGYGSDTKWPDSALEIVANLRKGGV